MRRVAISLILLSQFAGAQNDEAYGKKIKEYTTEPFFLTELVDPVAYLLCRSFYG